VKSTFRCSSNIALVKYWGKKSGGMQLPANPSISFTLKDLYTETTVSVTGPNNSGNPEFEFFFQGQPKPSFVPKLTDFFNRIISEFSVIKEFVIKIESSNNFPHGTGIASSASGFGALACCLTELEMMHTGKPVSIFETSKAARLGSGSACRSMFAAPAIWGVHQDINDSSDDFAIPAPFAIHDVFNNMMDAVLIVDAGEKSVSSTVGHGLLKDNPYAAPRYGEATLHLSELCAALETGDMKTFIRVVEQEALQLHAMMMLSNPYFILMRPATLSVIEAVWAFRAETGIPLMFTLDAGANVHLLFPKVNYQQVKNLIDHQLLIYCQNNQYFCSDLGSAPIKIQ
jgi:diphosphomevalonate decarboxylase